MSNVIAPNNPAIDPADAAMVERRTLSVALAVLGASANTDAFYVGDKGVLRATQTCTAVSGTSPTLDTTVMTCDTPDGTFYSAGTFTQVTAAGAQRKTFAVDRWVRFDRVIGGSSTPTVTHSIEAEAV
jgi:hypothetical protein